MAKVSEFGNVHTDVSYSYKTDSYLKFKEEWAWIIFEYLEFYTLDLQANWKPMGHPVPVVNITPVKE